MSEQETKKVSEEDKLKQMAAQMRAMKYKGLSEEEISKKERQDETRRKKNVQILNDTLNILNQGSYLKDDRKIKLHFSFEQMQQSQVFLPDDIELLREENSSHAIDNDKQKPDAACTFNCENTDTLVLAQKKYQDLQKAGKLSAEILVLNLASAATPGGQTRKGAGAQEEDLCRRTSLLLSLESESSKKYYDYNNSRKTHMGSDAIIISPYVDVIKDSSSETLANPFPVSVMSCSAPMIRFGLEGMSDQEYEKMLYKRILGMLSVAASQNYRCLILGAFGCGVYGNNAATVSDLFYRAICDFTYVGKNSDQLFTSVDFAVLCNTDNDYNYKEFYRNFSKR